MATKSGQPPWELDTFLTEAKKRSRTDADGLRVLAGPELFEHLTDALLGLERLAARCGKQPDKACSNDDGARPVMRISCHREPPRRALGEERSHDIEAHAEGG